MRDRKKSLASFLRQAEEVNQDKTLHVGPAIQRIYGVNTKMGFNEYVIHLLAYNEDRSVWPIPLTDKKLNAMLLKEFGRYEKSAASIMRGNTSICPMRAQYNEGKLLPGRWPSEKPGHPHRLSMRYDSEGRPVRGLGRKDIPYTLADLRERLAKYPRIQESFEDLVARLGKKAPTE